MSAIQELTLNKGLVCDLALNEGSGTKVFDRTENENHGTIVGATWVDDDRKSGKALNFAGVSDLVTLPSIEPTSFTVEGWFKANSDKVNTIYGMPSTQSSYKDITIKVNSGGVIQAYFGRGTTLRNYVHNDLFNVNDGSWHQVVTTYNEVTLKATVYVDKLSAPSSVLGSAIVYSGQPKWIGAYGLASSYSDGVIDSLRIWNRVLSPQEIRWSYERRRTQ